MSIHNYSEIFQNIKEELSNIRDRKEKKEKKGKERKERKSHLRTSSFIYNIILFK